MALLSGEKVIKIIHGRYWYRYKIGMEFKVLMYSIMEAEYTVIVDGVSMKIAEEDVEVVKDTSSYV